MYSDTKLSNATSLHFTLCYTAYGPALSPILLLLLLFISSTPSIASLLHCIFHSFPLRQFGAEVVGGDWGRLQNEAACWENRLVLLPITFERGSSLKPILFCFFLFLSAEVLLQCHGGRAAGFPQVPAPAQTQAPTTRHGENGGGHQHAHLQRPQTARERDHGLKWESQSLSHPLCCREELCRDTGERGQGKW